MVNRDRMRVVFHGGVVLLIGLLCGYPAVTESPNESLRLWHTAHETGIALGTLMFAMSSVLPLLVLARREATALVFTLVGTGYALMTGLVIEGSTGARAFQLSTSPIPMLGFLANATGILCSILAALLTITGARAALRAAAVSVPAS